MTGEGSLDRSRGALGRDLITGTPTQDGVRMRGPLVAGPGFTRVRNGTFKPRSELNSGFPKRDRRGPRVHFAFGISV